MPESRIIRAFVDETGDRGMKPTSSKYFAFAAVVCRDENVPKLVEALDRLVSDAGKPGETVLHWAQNLKDHRDRKEACRRLARLPVRLIYVAVPKSAVKGYLEQSTEAYYNYLARIICERIALFTKSRARDDPDLADYHAKVTFGRVKGFKPSVLQDYLDRVRKKPESAFWSNYLTPRVDVRGQSEQRLLQWADIAAGAFDSAAKLDKYGNNEPSYLSSLVPLIDRNPNDGRRFGYGIKTLGGYEWMLAIPNWPDELRA